MKVTIRTATEADVPSLGVLRGQAIEAAYSDEYARDQYADLVADPAADLRTWIGAEGRTVLLAETEITPVAYVVLDGTGEIRSIATNTDYQREGFASTLLDRLEERARERGIGELAVSAPPVVAGFFETQGFEPAGEAEWHGLPATRLTKPLDP